MEINEPAAEEPLSPRARVMKRLVGLGVPQDYVDRQQSGLVEYVKDNAVDLSQLITAIFPSHEDAVEAFPQRWWGDWADEFKGPTFPQLMRESMVWVEWLMFNGNPETAFKELSRLNSERGVCTTVWELNDIAYMCHTCEEHPGCAICVPCFQNGDHEGHDYFSTPITVGCCDCGRVTEWKRSGFCFKHGAEHIPSLPSEFASSIGPILDSLFCFWSNWLVPFKNETWYNYTHDCISIQVRERITYDVSKLLLKLCEHSECLLSVISEKMFSLHGFMEILITAEQLIFSYIVVGTLHKLLLKLLAEPQFKYKFAKVFSGYYPTILDEASSDRFLEKYSLIRLFSVQIFTVPTLTLQLVKEMDILPMLFKCLKNMLKSCTGDDGRLKVVNRGGLYERIIRVVEDIKFVMSHSAVLIFINHERQDITRTWMQILSFVQGMNSQKRETNMYTEEESENKEEYENVKGLLGLFIVDVHSCLVRGAFLDCSSDEVEIDSGHTTYRLENEDPDFNIGRISQECSVPILTGRNLIDHTSKVVEIKRDSSVFWLIFECLRTIDSCLVLDNSVNRFSSSASSGGILGRQSSITSRHSIVNLDSGQCLGQEAGASGSDEISMETECSTALESLMLLSSSDWPDIVDDVSSQEVSAHIPLHRLLSMLLQRYLSKCYGESASLNARAATSGELSSIASDDLFSNILRGCRPQGFCAFVMEHPLRIRAFCAQVQAGLWRANGDAAISSSACYNSARRSENVLELDLFLLQFCAAFAPPDLYVKRILECYGLSEYLKLNLDRSSEYEPILVQEMLALIIQIVKERRFCGLTIAECLRREMIHKLSAGDTTHSQLVESVPQDLLENGDLQNILDSVAEYSGPSATNQGMYKLRLECWKELDLYYPRYNSRELQMVKERYLHFCNVSAVTAQLPNWSKVHQPLSGIARIATCKTILQIVRTVLFNAVFLDESMVSRDPEGVLLTAVHLLSLALNICSLQRASVQSLYNVGEVIPILEFASEEISSTGHADQSLLSLLVILMRLHEKEKNECFDESMHSNVSSLCANILKKFAELESKCFIKLQKIAPEVVNQPPECNSNLDSNMIGLASDSEKRKAKTRERQAAVSEKMKAQQSKFLESIKPTVRQETDVSEFIEDLDDNDVRDLEEVCCLCHDTNARSPVCFLILLQKSKLLSFLDSPPVSLEHSSQSKDAHFSPRESAISNPLLISNVPDSSHPELAQLVQSAVDNFASDSQPCEINAFLDFINIHFPWVRNINCPLISENVLVKTSSIENLEEHMYSLVLENLRSKALQNDIQKYGDDFSTAEGTQERSSQSLLLCKYIASIARQITNCLPGSESVHEAQTSNSISHTYDGFGPSDCDGIYISSCGHAMHQECIGRYLSSLKDRYASGDAFEGSHIVDLDKGEFLCPMCRTLANSALPTPPRDSEKVCGTASALSNRKVGSLRIQYAACLVQSASFTTQNKMFLKSIPLQQIKRSNIDSLFRDACSMYFPSMGQIYEYDKSCYSLLLWDMLKYLIASTEISARSGKWFSSPAYGSTSLLKELKYSDAFMLSMLLNTVQGSRTENTPTKFLRFRGIQMFAESLCLGSSNVKRNLQEGNLLCLLETSEFGGNLDIQFWKRASNPVIAHDSFSSLMWVLFCLPTPFLSCKESFFCLVHIFYLVTITRAIVTYCRKWQCSLTKLGLKDCLITDICKVIKDNEVHFQCFESNYMDSSYDIKDAIRSLSSPFLRRCSLLWGLVNTSASSPISQENPVSHGSSNSVKHESNIVGIVEVERLESMFKIPPIDMVIYDDRSRSMARGWLRHFTKEFKPQVQNVLYCTPSVPFSLMVLPKLYGDLFIRYIKQQCPACEAELKEPALCLLCSKLCAPNGKPCCRCETHAMACGAGIGVFLLIKKTSILLQRAARQALWPPLYLDAFGEEDTNMYRGCPLYLNEERYAVLNSMVGSHDLDRSSRVLDRTTII